MRRLGAEVTVEKGTFDQRQLWYCPVAARGRGLCSLWFCCRVCKRTSMFLGTPAEVQRGEATSSLGFAFSAPGREVHIDL